MTVSIHRWKSKEDILAFVGSFVECGLANVKVRSLNLFKKWWLGRKCSNPDLCHPTTPFRHQIDNLVIWKCDRKVVLHIIEKHRKKEVGLKLFCACMTACVHACVCVCVRVCVCDEGFLWFLTTKKYSLVVDLISPREGREGTGWRWRWLNALLY